MSTSARSGAARVQTSSRADQSSMNRQAGAAQAAFVVGLLGHPSSGSRFADG
jgi:hypothetical protein